MAHREPFQDVGGAVSSFTQRRWRGGRSGRPRLRSSRVACLAVLHDAGDAAQERRDEEHDQPHAATVTEVVDQRRRGANTYERSQPSAFCCQVMAALISGRKDDVGSS
jgi:hypothetical protein